jgi:hypothetical protein
MRCQPGVSRQVECDRPSHEALLDRIGWCSLGERLLNEAQRTLDAEEVANVMLHGPVTGWCGSESLLPDELMKRQ